ncbi:MAG: hypothetical protein LBB26_02195 [Puniceicoccales bacterium]|jgi:hypothetical protein|nr:hypothetical protein [Puniceicoccales bacterium]
MNMISASMEVEHTEPVTTNEPQQPSFCECLKAGLRISAAVVFMGSIPFGAAGVFWFALRCAYQSMGPPRGCTPEYAGKWYIRHRENLQRDDALTLKASIIYWTVLLSAAALIGVIYGCCEYYSEKKAYEKWLLWRQNGTG